MASLSVQKWDLSLFAGKINQHYAAGLELLKYAIEAK